MLARVEEQNPPTDLSAIKILEQKHSIRLPESYKNFLIRTNGGRPEPSLFPISGLENNPYGRIHFLYGIDADHRTYNLDAVLSDLPASVPKGIIPIGCTGYEDTQIILDQRNGSAAVKYFDTIPFWGNNIWNESFLYPVAANFAALLASLKTDEEVGF